MTPFTNHDHKASPPVLQVEGEALRSCQFPVKAAQAKKITTIEGLPADNPVRAA
ncbi:MAG: hypothetical protein ABFS09_00035 [Thermodesulfobacteriota bacterium]